MIRVQTIFPRPQFNNFYRATVPLNTYYSWKGWCSGMETCASQKVEISIEKFLFVHFFIQNKVLNDSIIYI